MFSKFESDGKLNPTFNEGLFELLVSCTRAYLKDLITPRFVHVSSVGVTRPERPGIDLSKQPPTVRLKLCTYIVDPEEAYAERGTSWTFDHNLLLECLKTLKDQSIICGGTKVEWLFSILIRKVIPLMSSEDETHLTDWKTQLEEDMMTSWDLFCFCCNNSRMKVIFSGRERSFSEELDLL